MDIKKLKQYILDNNKIEYILNEIGCKNIKQHDSYYSCSNPDGDNPSAIVQYFNSEYLNCINYTRDIRYNKSENPTSLIDLVCYIKQINLFQTIKYLCDILELDYYQLENEDDIPESLKMLEMLYEMKSGDYIEENLRLQPIDENILKYYQPYVNNMFAKDNISYEIQREFEIGYDDSTNTIVIPIRDELGNLVGVKGRYFDNRNENKYIALERYAKSKILYGLYKSIKHIKDKGYCYVVEPEKGVMAGFNMGFYNIVATGGKKISRVQKNKLISLGVDIIFAYDKDVTKEEIEQIANDFNGVNVFMVYDNKDILDEKESPIDNPQKWLRLLNECIIKI